MGIQFLLLNCAGSRLKQYWHYWQFFKYQNHSRFYNGLKRNKTRVIFERLSYFMIWLKFFEPVCWGWKLYCIRINTAQPRVRSLDFAPWLWWLTLFNPTMDTILSPPLVNSIHNSFVCSSQSVYRWPTECSSAVGSQSVVSGQSKSRQES